LGGAECSCEAEWEWDSQARVMSLGLGLFLIDKLRYVFAGILNVVVFECHRSVLKTDFFTSVLDFTVGLLHVPDCARGIASYMYWHAYH
jgi:hypothetical protein